MGVYLCRTDLSKFLNQLVPNFLRYRDQLGSSIIVGWLLFADVGLICVIRIHTWLNPVGEIIIIFAVCWEATPCHCMSLLLALHHVERMPVCWRYCGFPVEAAVPTQLW
jgi:hypothetical protein